MAISAIVGIIQADNNYVRTPSDSPPANTAVFPMDTAIPITNNSIVISWQLQREANSTYTFQIRGRKVGTSTWIPLYIVGGGSGSGAVTDNFTYYLKTNANLPLINGDRIELFYIYDHTLSGTTQRLEGKIDWFLNGALTQKVHSSSIWSNQVELRPRFSGTIIHTSGVQSSFLRPGVFPNEITFPMSLTWANKTAAWAITGYNFIFSIPGLSSPGSAYGPNEGSKPIILFNPNDGTSTLTGRIRLGDELNDTYYLLYSTNPITFTTPITFGDSASTVSFPSEPMNYPFYVNSNIDISYSISFSEAYRKWIGNSSSLTFDNKYSTQPGIGEWSASSDGVSKNISTNTFSLPGFTSSTQLSTTRAE